MERQESFANKIVGGSPEDEAGALEELEFRANEEHVLEYEVAKSPEEIRLIEELSERLGGFVQQYGGSPKKFTPQSIRFLDYEKLPVELKKIIPDTEAGRYMASMQSMLFIKKFAPLSDARAIVHEMLHASSFNSFTVVEEAENQFSVRERRVGLGLRGRGEKLYFRDLNEAVTEELAQRFDRRFFGEIEYTKEDFAFRERIEREKGLGRAHSPYHDVVIRTIQDATKGWHTTIDEERTYPEVRGALWQIIDSILAMKRSDFKDREEVFGVFARAFMSGELLPLARLIEGVWGKGSFRKMGETNLLGIE